MQSTPVAAEEPLRIEVEKFSRAFVVADLATLDALLASDQIVEPPPARAASTFPFEGEVVGPAFEFVRELLDAGGSE